MSVSDCPSRESLFDYAVGRLPDDASEVLASHLDACTSCQTTLATLDDASDSLVARLRGPVADDPLLAEPECAVALARAKAVAGRHTAADSPPARRRQGPFPVPSQLGEYQLLEELGCGGMGTVYKALHTKLDRVVALKVLVKGRVEDQRAIARFEREMKAVGRLDHPQIVRAHDAREIDGHPVLIMEYVEGLDLARLVGRAGRLRVADACELARQVAVGLQYVHEHGLVHRDIKPSNLMLTPRGEVKILDLGLARFHRERAGSDEMTGTGQTMGTADYIAPEQASDSHGADIRADIYSLGCTLFKLLSGRAPFEGPEYRGAFDKMTAHVQTPAPSIRGLAANVPEELAALLGRMLAKDPAARPATPVDVAAKLAVFCAGHDLPALLSSNSGREAGPATGRTGFPPARGVLPPTRRKLAPLLLGLIGLGAVLVLAWAIVLHIRHNAMDTTVRVSDGSDVRIDADGRVDVKLPAEAAPGRPKPVAAVPPDEKAIQGTWKIVSSSLKLCRFPLGEDGREVRATADAVHRTTRVIITGDTLKVLGDDVVGEAFQYKLNPAASPPMIDLLSGGRAALGIYEMQGIRLKICADEAPQRPKEFWADLGSSKDLLVLERVGDAAVEPDEKTIQGTWEVLDCRTGATTGMGYAPLRMIVKAMFFKGQTLTIARHTLGLEDGDHVGSSATSHPGPSGVGGSGSVCRSGGFVVGSGGFVGSGGGLVSGGGGLVGSGGGLVGSGGGLVGGMGSMNPWIANTMSFGKPWGYALNPATSPKSIDLISTSGLALLGRYDLSGDRLKICVGVDRPQALAAGPQGKSALVVLRRVTGSGRPKAPRFSSRMDDLAARSGKFKPLRPLVVDVDSDGTATIAGTPIDADRLQTLVGLLLVDNPRRQVRLRCDADLPFSRAADLLAELQTAGMPRSSLLLAVAPTPAALLDFRVAASPGQDGEKPSLSEAQIKRYLSDLQAHGPTYLRTAREQARHTARQNALADLIASLEGIEKASVRIDAPPGGGENPPTVNVAVAAERPRAGPLDAGLVETVRDLAVAMVPRVEPDAVKVVAVGAKGAADAKSKDAAPAAADHKTDRAAGEPYAWFELDAEAPPPLVTAVHEGRKYVLLSVRPQDVMLAGEEGPRQWRIEGGSLGKAAPGRQTVRVTLDEAGARRMAALGADHRGALLAVLIDGRVVCLSKIQAKTAAQVEIDGSFDAHQADRLLRGLLGPPAGDEDTDSPSEEEDGQPFPGTGSGYF
jgi:uncharacterized protein (TIGR03067 family)